MFQKVSILQVFCGHDFSLIYSIHIGECRYQHNTYALKILVNHLFISPLRMLFYWTIFGRGKKTPFTTYPTQFTSFQRFLSAIIKRHTSMTQTDFNVN